LKVLAAASRSALVLDEGQVEGGILHWAGERGSARSDDLGKDLLGLIALAGLAQRAALRERSVERGAV
jgi:hypothetical protein